MSRWVRRRAVGRGGGRACGEADHEVDDGGEHDGLEDGHGHLHEAHGPGVRGGGVEVALAVLEPDAAVLQHDRQLRQAAEAEEHDDHEHRRKDGPARGACMGCMHAAVVGRLRSDRGVWLRG